MAIRVQDLSDEEPEKLRTMARSRMMGAGLVRRAQIVLHSVEGLTAPAISKRMGLPFASRTLDRSAAHLSGKGIGMKLSRVDRQLQLAEEHTGPPRHHPRGHDLAGITDGMSAKEYR